MILFIKQRMMFCLLIAFYSQRVVAGCPDATQSPDLRFDRSEPGLVKDLNTGLTWMQCDLGQVLTNGQCTSGQPWNSWFSWVDALKTAASITYSEASDWRLPTINELESILSVGCARDVFTSDKHAERTYWSASTDEDNSAYAWTIEVAKNSSNSELKSNASFNVRLVRGRSQEMTDSEEFVALDTVMNIIKDDIHDENNIDLKLLQPPDVAFDKLSRTRTGNVDWVASIERNEINPRMSLDVSVKDDIFDLTILMAITRKMPYVQFKHSVHTEWLTCSNCHPAIFKPQMGANNIKMDDILKGEFCGTCHGSVAFSPLECERCHNVLHKDSPVAWWRTP